MTELGSWQRILSSHLQLALTFLSEPLWMIPDVEKKFSRNIQTNTINKDGRTLKLEISANSVRVSVRLRSLDSLETCILIQYVSFIYHRAESLIVLRRKAIPGFHLSFLITTRILANLGMEVVQKMVTEIVLGLETELAESALFPHQRARKVAKTFLSEFINTCEGDNVL
mmetsp:Transcript_24000/g.30539  ORF Transcript_24000/g.30539 Transcript_24000/m.30539 type:complete len:170 (-) Transcript_24000:217-726(-)